MCALNEVKGMKLFMKYAFVTISIISIWIATIIIVMLLDYQNIILPIIALVMTTILFTLGFGGNK